MPDGSSIVAVARLDNRSTLLDLLGIPAAEHRTLTDERLVTLAYARWAAQCVNRLLGDWSFAAWDAPNSRLLLARDQFGIGSLYYCRTPDFFAFSTDRKALLSLDPSLQEVNDLYVAQMALGWHVYNGAPTAHRGIFRLSPAHRLTVSQAGDIALERYWSMQPTHQLPVHSLAEAVEGFLPLFDEAVGCRLQGATSPAVTLSGGLDSGAVAASAGLITLRRSQTLTAFTSLPLYPTAIYNDRRFQDEWSLAAESAAAVGVTNHRKVDAASVTPLDSIRAMLWIHNEPIYAAVNQYWIVDMLATASKSGHDLLLTGQMGNMGISWTGLVPAHAQGTSWRGHIKKWAQRYVPGHWYHWLELHRTARMLSREGATLLNPSFAQESDVVAASIEDTLHPSQLGRNRQASRLNQLMPGRSNIGFYWAESAAAYGIPVRDPTMDIRVLEYCLALPDPIFYDPQTGMDRMLIRAAMAGRLPDSVRLNRKRGLQAADIVFRLRADRDNMEACLTELESGRAADYLSMRYMRRAWHTIMTRTDDDAYTMAARLLRGIMAGLFVQQPGGGARPHVEALSR